jgi:hypothetical protein
MSIAQLAARVLRKSFGDYVDGSSHTVNTDSTDF